MLQSRKKIDMSIIHSICQTIKTISVHAFLKQKMLYEHILLL